MRFKKRYLLYKVEGQKLTEKELRLVVNKSIAGFIGEMGTSEANLKIMDFNEAKQLFFIRSALDSVETIIAALAFVTSFNNAPVALRLQKMSGSVKHVWSDKRK